MLMSLCLLWCLIFIWWSYGWFLRCMWKSDMMMTLIITYVGDDACICYFYATFEDIYYNWEFVAPPVYSMLILMIWHEGDGFLTKPDCTILCYDQLMMMSSYFYYYVIVYQWWMIISIVIDYGMIVLLMMYILWKLLMSKVLLDFDECLETIWEICGLGE